MPSPGYHENATQIFQRDIVLVDSQGQFAPASDLLHQSYLRVIVLRPPFLIIVGHLNDMIDGNLAFIGTAKNS